MPVFSPVERLLILLLIFFLSFIDGFVYTLAFLPRVGETAFGNKSFVKDANSY